MPRLRSLSNLIRFSRGDKHGNTKHRQNKPAPQIKYSELELPDEKDFGTGRFTSVLKKQALRTHEIISIVFNPPHFQLSVTLNTHTKQIPVGLGRVDGTPLISNKTFLLPRGIFVADTHTLVCEFKDWKIVRLTLDDIELTEA